MTARRGRPMRGGVMPLVLLTGMTLVPMAQSLPSPQGGFPQFSSVNSWQFGHGNSGKFGHGNNGNSKPSGTRGGELSTQAVVGQDCAAPLIRCGTGTGCCQTVAPQIGCPPPTFNVGGTCVPFK